MCRLAYSQDNRDGSDKNETRHEDKDLRMDLHWDKSVAYSILDCTTDDGLNIRDLWEMNDLGHETKKRCAETRNDDREYKTSIEIALCSVRFEL